jgi:hypothetical protein
MWGKEVALYDENDNVKSHTIPPHRARRIFGKDKVLWQYLHNRPLIYSVRKSPFRSVLLLLAKRSFKAALKCAGHC